MVRQVQANRLIQAISQAEICIWNEVSMTKFKYCIKYHYEAIRCDGLTGSDQENFYRLFPTLQFALGPEISVIKLLIFKNEGY